MKSKKLSDKKKRKPEFLSVGALCVRFIVQGAGVPIGPQSTFWEANGTEASESQTVQRRLEPQAPASEKW